MTEPIDKRRAPLSREAPNGLRRRKIRPRPTAGRSWGWRYALIASLVILAVDFALAAALPRHVLRIGIGSLSLDATMLLALALLYHGRPYRPADLGLRATSGLRAVGLTFAGLIAYVAIAVVWVLLVLGEHRHQATPQLHAGTAGVIVAGVATCVVAPVTEELFYRGFLYRAVRNRLNVTWSIAIVAVLFAAGHASTYPADTLPIKALFAVITCLLYERTDSLYPGIALHCLVDGSGYEASVSHGVIWIAPAACAALGLVVLLRHRLRPQTEHGSAPARPPSGSPSRMTEALAARFGYRSPQWVLAMTGGLIFLIGFVITFINVSDHPGARYGHSREDLLFSGLIVIGLLMFLAAVVWRLFRRPTGPRR